MTLGLGIDTGGTYTDSVVLDMDTKEIVCRSKALTTRDNLINGIVESLKGLSVRDGISLVSLSSTLATNAIVEGKSCRVGLIVLGKKFGHTVKVNSYAYIDAEIDLKGRVVKSLNPKDAEAAIESMRGKVDVLAVVGYMSVRNPTHENTVRTMAAKMLGIPIVCAHDLTSKLGFEQRANTAIINAGLIPTIIELIGAVTSALNDMGIDAPLMVVKGDGSVMNSTTAARRPIETILSGPASSLTSAMVHTGVKDALIVDIGGTTTDLGIIRDGFVRTLDTGALVGGNRTRVRAADVTTYGIGGDSRISVEKGGIVLSPIRIIPLCIAARRWPNVREWIMSLDSLAQSPSDIICDCELYTRASNGEMSYLTESDKRFLGEITSVPKAAREVSETTGINPERFCLRDLESEGYVTRIGVTPTDILAAEGTYLQYDTEVSAKAVELLAGKAGMSAEAFITKAKKAIVEKIARCIMDHMLRTDSGKDELTPEDMNLMDEMFRGHEGYRIRMDLAMPLVGIGAPVGAWLPGVADILGAELILPENYDVGNAIGAISSSVMETVEIPVRAAFRDFSEDPECIVYNGEDQFDFSCIDDAVEFALSEARRIATARAVESGADDVRLEEKVDRMMIDVDGSGKKVFRGATVVVRATGKPMMHWFKRDSRRISQEIDEFYGVQVIVHHHVELLPHRQCLAYARTGAFESPVEARDRGQLALRSPQYFADGVFVGMPGQSVPSALPGHAGNQSGILEGRHDGFEILLGYLLSLGDVLQGDRRIAALGGHVEHRTQSVPPPGGHQIAHLIHRTGPWKDTSRRYPQGSPRCSFPRCLALLPAVLRRKRPRPRISPRGTLPSCRPSCRRRRRPRPRRR